MVHIQRVNLNARDAMATNPVKGPASYFASIEAKYGRAIEEWKDLIRGQSGKKHMELVAWLKEEHGLGHGHANALVADTLREYRSATPSVSGIPPSYALRQQQSSEKL
jgi:hypothetical protein